WGAGIHPLSTAAVPMVLTGLLVAPVAWAQGGVRDIHLATGPVLALFYLALIGSAVPFTLYFTLLKRLKATQLSLINYAVPVVAVIVGAVFLKQPVTVRAAIGAALVLLRAAVAGRAKPKPARARRKPVRRIA